MPLIVFLANWLTLVVKRTTAPHNNIRCDMRGDTMTNNRTDDYTDERNDGHVDTREANFQCDSPDEHLGCDMGIDVAG